MELDQSLSADESVAHGAAIYASLLMGTRPENVPQFSVKNVNSHSLGVLAKDPQTKRPKNSIVIPKNTPLPANHTKGFKTAKPDQRSVGIKVIEGGDKSGQNTTPIGTCVIRDLPPGLPAKTSVEVTFAYAENGRLMVRARIPSIDQEAVLNIERESGMTNEAIDEWQLRLQDADGPLVFKS